MNQELMGMAKQAHQKLVSEVYVGHTGQLDPWTMELLKIFAPLVAAAEREACAKVIEPKNPRPCDCASCDCGNSGDFRAVVYWDASVFIANLIRARGEAK
jgi:hypothetical protein